MRDDASSDRERDRLRREAESRLPRAAHPDPHADERSSVDILHELQVHRIELEMQNEELRRIQAELESEHAKYFDLYELAPAGYLTLDDDGTILESNLTASQMFGEDRGDLVGRRLIEYVHVDDRDEYYLCMRRQHATGDIAVCEFRSAPDRCTVAWLHMDAVLGTDTTGATVQKVVLTDVSARRAAQDEVLLSRDHLEEVVAARTAELVETNERLAEADAAKSVFLANMSHELRTPLNSIIGFSGTLLQGLAGELNDEQQRQIEMVNASGQYLLVLVQEILDLSQVESGRLELDVSRFDLVQLANDVMHMLEPAIRDKGLTAEVIADPGSLPVRSDRRRVEQVLVNLAGSAVKFTKGGSITLRLGIAPDAKVEIAVSDTGCGIAHGDLERMFQAFIQLEHHDVAKSKGTGLGLAISRRYARILGGDITATSAPGVGSTFVLTLPQDISA